MPFPPIIIQYVSFQSVWHKVFIENKLVKVELTFTSKIAANAAASAPSVKYAVPIELPRASNSPRMLMACDIYAG